MNANILITGASGMLGSCLVKLLDDEFNVFATGNSLLTKEFCKNYKPFDLNFLDYKDLIEWSTPDIIIHCAANTNGSSCQKNPLKALNVNGISVRRFIDATDPNVKIIYISTDAVFPSHTHMAKETDCVAPESVYGKSKELGEFFLRQSDRKFCIIRTTIVGLNLIAQRKGFVEWIINSVKEDKPISLFNDVLFNPISIWHLAGEIKNKIIPNQIQGIYHIAGSEVCSKYQFGLLLLKELNISNNKISAGSIGQFEGRYGQSTDQTLCTDLYANTFNVSLPNILETILEIKNQYS